MHPGSKLSMLHYHCNDTLISMISKQCAKEPEVLVEAGGRTVRAWQSKQRDQISARGPIYHSLKTTFSVCVCRPKWRQIFTPLLALYRYATADIPWLIAVGSGQGRC